MLLSEEGYWRGPQAVLEWDRPRGNRIHAGHMLGAKTGKGHARGVTMPLHRGAIPTAGQRGRRPNPACSLTRPLGATYSPGPRAPAKATSCESPACCLSSSPRHPASVTG